jgi:hypothetical protein
VTSVYVQKNNTAENTYRAVGNKKFIDGKTSRKIYFIFNAVT